MSVGIVAMTDKSSNPDFEALDWDVSQKGLILSSFFWGYMVMQIPAGSLAKRFGPAYLLAASMIFCGVFTVVIPVIATHSTWVPILITRILQGLGQGFIYPAVNTHMSKWCVPQERSRLFAFVFGGTQLGSIIMLMAGGSLAAGPGGWPSIFYVSGAAAIIWGIICAIFGADSPMKHRTISTEERDYIESSLVHSSAQSHKMTTPWKAIATSVPMIALTLTHLGQNWGFWTLLTLMPSYIGGNGLLSALPYFAMWVLNFIFSFIADFIIKKEFISINVSRKMWNSIAHYGGAIALIGLAYIENVAGAIALLTVSVALNCGCYMGYLCNHLDLSPNFAGTLMGITNCIANITSILAPIIASFIVVDQNNEHQWRIVFLISAAIFLIGNTIFIIFGSTQVQPWNTPKEEEKESKNAHYGEAVGLILLGTVDTDGPVAMLLMTITVALNAGTYSGYLSNHLDLSPNFAGTLMGITNGISNISSILGPLVAGYIITDGVRSEFSLWNISGLFLAGSKIMEVDIL
ncbi:hypothetical protein AAG570_010437 [Ranatra chinensis]|uniref:Major facilitator superfamily (MFS) profile domain-containing protein n=1 Tax=Ranatra chinensis TaxID=642074 RepID=A0ABD0YMM9_9HEMI